MRLVLIKCLNGDKWLVPKDHYENVYKVMSKEICRFYLSTCGECGSRNAPTTGGYCIGLKCEYKQKEPKKRKRPNHE